MRRPQSIADRVVLEREQGVQDGEPEPEIGCHAGEVDVLLEIAWQQPVRVDAQLAVFVRA